MKGYLLERRPQVWRISVDLPPGPGGKRKQKTETYYGGKRGAQARLREILTALDQGTYSDSGKITVGDYLLGWLKKLKVSNATAERYRTCCTLHLIPALGHHQLSKLTTVAVEDCYANLNLAPRTIRLIHRTLVTALNAAIRRKLLGSNPAVGAERPTVVADEARFLHDDELARVLDAAKARGNFYVPILLAATSGLRVGEIAALQWRDVTLSKAGGKVSVKRTVERLAGIGLQVKDTPKTKHGRRTVALPAITVRALRIHRWKQYRAYQPLGLKPEWVFPNSYGELNSPSNISQAFTRICTKLGVDASIHALRHSHASQLIASGVPLKVISDRLGHSSIRVTADIYGHLIRDADEKAADLINERFSG